MEDRRKLADGKEIWVIKAGFPDEPVKRFWSEYAFSNSLKKYLERLGYFVIIESADEWYGDDTADAVIVLRGHKEYYPIRKNKDCIYIMWNLSHPSTITDEEYNSYDLICIGSEVYAGRVRARLNVPVRVLPMCADTEIFFPDEEEKKEKEYEYEWVFVGNSRFVKRKSVVWSIAHHIPLNIWGANWEKVLPESAEYVVAENIPNDELPALYRNAKVTVDDHYEDMALNGFINTRIIEAMACGLPVISDYSETLNTMFGDAVLCYHNENEFVKQTKRIAEDYDTVKERVRKVWPVIRENYSFKARAEQFKSFITEIREHGEACKELVRSFADAKPEEKAMHAVCEREFMPEIKVSVIIPVYNAEKYLAECMDSVTGQTLREIEIICIDDGSTDSSLKLLRGYAEKDKRISVYTQENRGLSAARNRGIEKARGEYIEFLDSDDWLKKDAVEKLYRTSAERKSEILFFNGDTFYEDDNARKMHSEFQNYYLRTGEYPESCDGPEMLTMMRERKEYRTSVVMQLFERSFLEKNRLRFCPGILHEDNDFTFIACLLSENTGYLPERLYKRRVHGESVMTKETGIKHVYGYFRAFLNMLSFVDGRDFSDDTWEAVSDIFQGILYNIKKHFRGLSWQEQQAFDWLDKRERLLFRLYVQPESDGFPALGKARRENSELCRKLQKTYTEKSEINRKLQKTYADKSEINRKLQLTYKEKYDRGLEIKRLKKEVASIKKSRTYRLARIIGFPVRMLRKIVGKTR